MAKLRSKLPPRIRNFKCRQVYHVYQRGSQRQRVFDGKAHVVFYLDRLDRLARRYKVRIHAFCLMDNHVHFMFEPERKGGISRLMQHLQSYHARYMNGIRHTDGHLWRNHFEAKHIASSAQYQATLLYIEKNPVVAGICKTAHRYAFSSAVAHTENQPIYTLARHEREAQVKLYLPRWRKEFGIAAEGPTDWPTWLRSPREATHNNLTNSGARAAGQDLAEILGAQDVKAIEGKPLLPAWKPSPLPPAEARALSAREASTVRFATARGS